MNNSDNTEYEKSEEQKALRSEQEGKDSAASGAGEYSERLEFTAGSGLSVEDTYDTKRTNAVKISRRGNGLASAAVVAGLFLLSLFLFNIMVNMGSGADYGRDGPYTGVLYITGEIKSAESGSYTDTYQHDWLLSQIAYMEGDNTNRGIMLCVDSPGGSVYQSDELYEAIMEYKENTGRPVYAYFEDTAASGAYYVSMAADVIFANKNTITGSVGVYIGPFIDASQLLANLGVSVTMVKSAENKAMGNYYQPLTEEQIAILQSEVDEFYGRFVDLVAQGRHMDAAQVRQLADGRIYTASQALQYGLIDGIGTLEDALDRMYENCGVGLNPVAVRYVPETDLYSSIARLGGQVSEWISKSGRSEAEATLEYLRSVNNAEVKYLMK